MLTVNKLIPPGRGLAAARNLPKGWIAPTLKLRRAAVSAPLR
jgi:hypothetical protein